MRIATSRSDWYLVKFPVAIKAQGSGLRTTYFRSLLRLILAVSPTRVFSRVATTRVKCHLWHVSLLHTHAYTEHVKPRMRRNKLRKPHSAVGALAQRRRGPDPLRSGTPAGRAGRRWAVARARGCGRARACAGAPWVRGYRWTPHGWVCLRARVPGDARTWVWECRWGGSRERRGWWCPFLFGVRVGAGVCGGGARVRVCVGA